jgi:rubredoxin
MAELTEMYQCQTTNCGYIYNPGKGDRKGKIKPGILFADLPESWRCPICGGTKKCFRPLAGPGSTKDAADCELPTR